MNYNEKELEEKLKKNLLRDWEGIPDIGLYMDQVVQILNSTVSAKKSITPNMINNYVKDGYLDRPEKKKYTRTQLVQLFLIMQVKPVLSIQEISAALNGLGSGDQFQKVYSALQEHQKNLLNSMNERVKEFMIDKGYTPAFLAMQLSLEACMLRNIAELILANESDHGPEGEGEA